MSNNENALSVKHRNISENYKTLEQPKTNWTSHLLTLILVNSAIWALAVLSVNKIKPTYISEWTINVPGSASSANINLPNIGQAISQNYSAYAASSYDPRENYKAIATSEEVLKPAASAANMPLKEYGTPRIKIVDNTTLIKFELRGLSPEEAQKKSKALYQALLVKLNELRNEEISQHNARLQLGIEDSHKKLKASQTRLSNYKASSGLNSDEQLSNLAINIESLRKQRAELIAQEQQSNALMSELSTSLSLSSEQANDAFVLQADPLFQKYLSNFTEARSKLIALDAKFLADHPALISQKAEQDMAEAALVKRAESLLKRPLSIENINKFFFSNKETSGGTRTGLSEELVKNTVQKKGINAQIKALDEQILQLENRLKTFSQRQSKLEDLKRDVQVSEAVFSSTIAAVDLSKSSISASYPQIQLISEPSLPSEKAGPKKNLIFLGAGLGSLLLSSGIIGLRLFKRPQEKLNSELPNN